MIKKAGRYFITAYLLIMFCIYPFYVNNGYLDIGDAKFRFFKLISLAAFLLLMVCVSGCGIMRMKDYYKQKRTSLVDWNRVSSTDLLVLLYATEIFLSYVFSDYRKEALWGAYGWYMGLITLLLLCSFYFFISRFWDGKNFILYLCVAASAIVFLLGICSRFSFYPLHLEGNQSDYISTLGNINWFCGYLSVTAPVGICLFFLEQEKAGGRSIKSWLFGGYTLLAFMAGFCQGSSSVFLWFFALFFFLLLVAPDSQNKWKAWFFLLFLWGLAAQVVRLLRIVLPENYNYDTDNLCGYLTDSSVTLWIGLAALAAAVYLHFAGKQGRKARRIAITGHGLQKGLLILAAAGVLGWITFSLVNTKWGIPGFKNNSFFIFDNNWGNGRGAAVYAGAKAFWGMPFWHKLFGAGPDCFASYVYSVPELAVLLRENFGADRLTNAHVELLTGLVNTGIFGVLLYLGIFFSQIRKVFRRRKKDAAVLLFGACMFCYLIHNMVSFAQVLNLPFVFFLMGMCERRLREEVG